MGRWEPNGRGRLAQAALDLYVERGFDQTTVAEIAERAGLTERTFFRHFADKREVLFDGSSLLQQSMVDAVAAAPASASPMEAAAAALEPMGELFDQRRDFARRRHSVISVNPELKERELIKLATLTEAIAATLHERGVAEPAASLAAQATIGVFHVTFQRWVAPGETRELGELMRESLAELKAVVR
ncbi:TetR family transcriptional regulator [Streptacidiphilus pinicola]|uniref:TetR family transcriptional regulator n=1 Tax=Streptacidiphilus pinicola TaxID=2219663 RepID=A0A2X0J9A1_9ACTN|nr:TetR family transcriptional regulator [Streptacidiphilus pinicola]RAG86876.1 TetR family transcriptional regulator [Streptacidiphilus pinicola]